MMKTMISGFKSGFMLLLVGAFMAGCGGSSSTPPATTVSGVAAAGAPIIGWAYLKDSLGATKGPNDIAVDGSFSFDVTGLTAPFYLVADGAVGGQSYRLHSAAITAGTANINPLTDLAVAAAAGVSDPGSVYSNPSAHPINQTNLDQAVADIQNMLKPLLDAYNANINPITGSYTANHTGLDAVLDVVKVDVNTSTGAVAVTDKTTNTQIGTATTTTIATPTNTITTTEIPSTTTVTDLQAIATRISGLATVLNKGTSLTAADLDPYFASTYGINNGWNRTQDINDWVMNFSSMINKSITSVTNLALNGKNGSDYSISFTVYFSDGSFFTSFEFLSETIVTNEGGTWKLKGNGYKSDALRMIGASTRKRISADETVKVESGIWFEMDDNGSFLQSAVVTGPGLPQAGIIMTKPLNDTRLNIDPLYRNSQIHQDTFYVMSDTAISQIPDNAVYTFKIYDAGNNLIETRTKTIQRPFMLSELTAGHYPTFGGITSHSLSSVPMGSTVNFTYAKPTAYQTNWMDSHLYYSDNSSHNVGMDKQLLIDKTSASMIIGSSTWTPTNGDFEISARSSSGREVRVEWVFQ